jgi:alpha-galactosidase/6-phospho-beta-glucosidase family protein
LLLELLMMMMKLVKLKTDEIALKKIEETALKKIEEIAQNPLKKKNTVVMVAADISHREPRLH